MANKGKKVRCKNVANPNNAGLIWFLGFIGAAVYYISSATGFWGGVLGFLKALVWPAFLVFELLIFLG
jgi:hypothetical protein